ncbi:ubiquitin-related domain-containing protein [Xylariales sp. AK1849]|nr:ubiquitin-related domain-containing protein [Xylariales sp. AK1849]
MITIWVNDRLGTKKEVPCFPSDTVGQFKIVVAALIGRKPQQIVLQRQGERPLKDMITIADYQIKSGSQLDLEVGTAD